MYFHGIPQRSPPSKRIIGILHFFVFEDFFEFIHISQLQSYIITLRKNDIKRLNLKSPHPAQEAGQSMTEH